MNEEDKKESDGEIEEILSDLDNILSDLTGPGGQGIPMADTDSPHDDDAAQRVAKAAHPEPKPKINLTAELAAEAKAEEEAAAKAAAAAKKAAEEKIKAEAAAKRKAEEEKAAAEAKRKAAAEQARAEAEAKRKAEEEKAQAEADAKKAAEEKAKAEADAKKAAEEKAKAEAEAKQKAAEEKAKAEAEAKQKAAEEKAKAEAEAKKAEEDKAKAEAKTKAEAEPPAAEAGGIELPPRAGMMKEAPKIEEPKPAGGLPSAGAKEFSGGEDSTADEAHARKGLPDSADKTSAPAQPAPAAAVSDFQEKGIPPKTPPEQVRRLAYLVAPDRQAACDKCEQFLFGVADKVSKRPLYLHTALIVQVTPDMSPIAIMAQMRARGAAGAICISDGILDAQLKDIEDAFDEEDVFFRKIPAAEIGSRTTAIELVVDMMLLKAG